MVDSGGRVQGIRRRLAAAAARAGRSPDAVELIAISKTRAPAEIQPVVNAGVRALGENRVQEAARKIPEIVGPVEWHLVGRLQSNKARLAASLFDAVHSVDSPSLARRLDAAAERLGRTLRIWVQVDFTRSGAPLPEVVANAREVSVAVAAAPALRLEGLMTLPPFDPDPEAARPWFRDLRQLRDQIAAEEHLELPGLSMGMSNDFEVAVEEGATIVRVGTAIFGARD